jgi:translation initiation factor 3 subunit D
MPYNIIAGRKIYGQTNRNAAGRGYGRGNKRGQELQVVFNSGKNLKGGRGMQGQGRSRTMGGGRMNRRNTKIDRAPSLAVSSDWSVIEEFDLSQLLKLQANAPKVEDLSWCGELDQYNEAMEKITTRTAKPLKKVSTHPLSVSLHRLTYHNPIQVEKSKIFYSVTTKDDPVMEGFLVEDVGDVYATDSILSTLVAAPRSIYSWDIIIEKSEGKIFLDKRDDNFDFLTVSETAQEPPTTNEEMDEFNHPINLSREATAINQNFSQQILLQSTETSSKKKFEPNPFYVEADEGEPASVVYRYRKFTLGDIRLVVRCEMHGYAKKAMGDQYLTCYALNEWDSRFAGGMNWRQKLDQQRGAVLGTEIKNNSCKLAKWAVQSLLADADLMKIGYVSRVNPSNPVDHAILSTQSFKPKEFSTQINLNATNIWGIIKMFCELLMGKEDGKYVLLKDPNKSTVRLYVVPPETFEDEDKEDGEDEGFNEDDDDEDD